MEGSSGLGRGRWFPMVRVLVVGESLGEEVVDEEGLAAKELGGGRRLLRLFLLLIWRLVRVVVAVGRRRMMVEVRIGL